MKKYINIISPFDNVKKKYNHNWLQADIKHA